MAQQFYCGVFDKLPDAQIAANFYSNQHWTVSGPTQYKAATLDSMLNGQQATKPTANTWVVIATV